MMNGLLQLQACQRDGDDCRAFKFSRRFASLLAILVALAVLPDCYGDVLPPLAGVCTLVHDRPPRPQAAESCVYLYHGVLVHRHEAFSLCDSWV